MDIGGFLNDTRTIYLLLGVCVLSFVHFVYSYFRDKQYRKVLYDKKAQAEKELKELDVKFESQLRTLEEHNRKLGEILKKGK
jgi:hypothetical protein